MLKKVLKQAWLPVLVVVTVGLLITGKVMSDNKVKAQIAEAKAAYEEEQVNRPKLRSEELANYATHFSKTVKNKLEKQETVQLALIVSDAQNKKSNYVQYINENLREVYGENAWNVNVFHFKGTTSDILTSKEFESLLAFKPDMVMWEIALLEDNNIIAPEETMQNVKQVMKQVKEENKKVEFVLQAPQPIYKASFYPIQENALQLFAKDNKVTYLDHWTQWPDYQTEEFTKFVDADKNGEPNEDGYNLWTKAMMKYFIGEQAEFIIK